MKVAIAILMAVLPTGCAAQGAPLRAAQPPEMEVLIRRDSAGGPLVAVDSLAYPHQVPWHGQFFVSVRFPAEYPLGGLEARVGLDLWMGPQVYGGPDGELLLTLEADRLGSWYRSEVMKAETLQLGFDRPREILIGPFALLDVIPGPDGAEARLWPTRLRVVLDLVPLERSNQSTEPLHQSKVVFLR